MSKIAIHKVVLSAGGAVVFLWGILGLVQARSWGQAGYETEWGARVVHVEPGGPADTSGLEKDDRILRVGGAPIKNPWVSPSRNRLGVGSVQRLQVDRKGETMLVDVTWGSLDSRMLRALVVDSLIALSFLGCGLWALLQTGARAGLLLAVFGLCYGLANLKGPGPGFSEGAIAFARSNLSVFYTALLCYFLMTFPKSKGILRRPLADWIFFIPFLAFLIFGFVEWFSFPALLDKYVAAAMLTDLFYMILALAALIHSWVSSPRAERWESGLNWIALGLLVAFGPFILFGLIGMAAPGFTPPGQDYLPLLGALIPAGMAVAVVTRARVRLRCGL